MIENGHASERIVKTGASDGDLIEIVEGVKAGENVATSNLDKLQEGTASTAEVMRWEFGLSGGHVDFCVFAVLCVFARNLHSKSYLSRKRPHKSRLKVARVN